MGAQGHQSIPNSGQQLSPWMQAMMQHSSPTPVSHRSSPPPLAPSPCSPPNTCIDGAAADNNIDQEEGSNVHLVPPASSPHTCDATREMRQSPRTPSPHSLLSPSLPHSPANPLRTVHPIQNFLARYMFEGEIGEGQYGRVWRCTDRLDGQEWAVKQINWREGSMAARREMECIEMVKGHPNIVQVVQLYGDSDSLFIVMELCSQGDLFHCIANGGMPEQHARPLFRQIVAAVGHCHSRGILHRDIKPENILLQRPSAAARSKRINRDTHRRRRQPHVATCDWRRSQTWNNHEKAHASGMPGPECSRSEAASAPVVKLTDFGLATRLGPTEKVRGNAGTFPYQAPEVVRRHPYDFSADIWSLGVVLYGMLSGCWPEFTEDGTFSADTEFNEPGWRSVSGHLKDLICWLLQTEPEGRPSIEQVLSHPWCRDTPSVQVPSRQRRSLSRTWKSDREQSRGKAWEEDHRSWRQESAGLHDPLPLYSRAREGTDLYGGEAQQLCQTVRRQILKSCTEESEEATLAYPLCLGEEDWQREASVEGTGEEGSGVEEQWRLHDTFSSMPLSGAKDRSFAVEPTSWRGRQYEHPLGEPLRGRGSATGQGRGRISSSTWHGEDTSSCQLATRGEKHLSIDSEATLRHGSFPTPTARAKQGASDREHRVDNFGLVPIPREDGEHELATPEMSPSSDKPSPSGKALEASPRSPLDLLWMAEEDGRTSSQGADSVEGTSLGQRPVLSGPKRRATRADNDFPGL